MSTETAHQTGFGMVALSKCQSWADPPHLDKQSAILLCSPLICPYCKSMSCTEAKYQTFRAQAARYGSLVLPVFSTVTTA